MDSRLVAEIRELEETHWWYRGRRRIVGEQIQLLGLRPGIEILDAGCGSGRNMVDLALIGPVTGLDIDEPTVALAQARDVGEVVHGSITEMPFAAERFEFAICTDVIEHIEDDALALRELHGVLAPGGLLLVTVPAYKALWGEHDVINQHKRRYTRRSLASVAASAGWEAVYSTYFNGLLLPAAAAHRWLSRLRYSPARPASSDLQRTPGYLEPALERTLALEAQLIARGRRIAAGLSLMLVLRKPPGTRTPAPRLD